MLLPIFPSLLKGAELLSLLVDLCFSFFILLFTSWYKNRSEKDKMLGVSFFSPLIFAAAALFTNDNSLANTFYNMVEPSLFMTFLLALTFKPPKEKTSYFKFIIFTLPVFITVVMFNYPGVIDFVLQKPILFYAVIILAAAVILMQREEKGPVRYFSLTTVFIAASAVIRYFYSIDKSLLWFSVSFKLAAYSVVLFYFHQILIKEHMEKFESLETQISEMDHSIESEVKKRVIEVERVNRRLVDISKMDSMCEVMNKKATMDAIDTLIKKYPKSVFSILLFDIDDFKNINDTYGHITGDNSIKFLSTTGKGSIRDFDMIGRYGGDEFIIILPNIEVEYAYMIAERFRKRIDASSSPHFTISIGIATYPGDGMDVKALIKAADEELYRAKEMGKNTSSHKTLPSIA